MKRMLELELSEDSYFDKSYILNRLERETMDVICVSPLFIANAGIRFVVLSNFHDAKIMGIADTKKYGKSCALFIVNFKNTTTEFKNGYKKFDISFINAEYIEPPIKSKELYITELDCVQQSYNLIISMELVYFTGTQEHRSTCKIKCIGIEVKPCL